MTLKRQGRCPRCGQPAALDPGNRYRPFCSERCKLLDFGAWISGQYSIPASDEAADGDDDPAQPPARLQ